MRISVDLVTRGQIVNKQILVQFKSDHGTDNSPFLWFVFSDTAYTMTLLEDIVGKFLFSFMDLI